MNIKAIFLISVFFLISIISISNVSAYYSYPYGYDLYPVYSYYEQDDKYDNIPIVMGPYPRGYIWNWNADSGVNTDYLFDDFNHYDEFIGYKDLDLFYANGVVEVIRNPNSRELDTSSVPEGMQTFGNHVYGYIPGPGGSCVMYRKHYNHEHPWEVEEYSYTYNYGYNYYLPLAYRNTPPTFPSCQQRSICQLTHSCS